MGIVQFVLRNWKMLVAIFCLGGTAAVFGVIPGLEGLKNTVDVQRTSAEAKLVSGTTVQ